MSDTSPEALASLCRTAILREAEALATYARDAGSDLSDALTLMGRASGPLIIAGVGKSGHVARKMASTFASIGKPAIFVHAAEASHGDMGLIGPDNVVIVLSNSGETPELSDMLHYCRTHKVPMVAITATRESSLGRAADVTIAHGKVEEVCVIGLAPTTSTTLAMAIGDALAVGLTRMLDTHPEDFRRYHPGGKLGARLTLVADVMHTGADLPKVRATDPMSNVVVEMSRKSLGVAVVVDDSDHIDGIITDGDMRRHADALFESSAADIASTKPITVAPDITIDEAVEVMTNRGITSCLVADDKNRLKGLLHIHDCLRLGVGK